MSRTNNQNRAEWLIPVGLILLSLVPVVGGSVRLAELSSGVEIEMLPDSARIASAPIPIVIHIISVIIYSILGAFQFVPSFRRHRRTWHRVAGRILIPSGVVVALSGLWMTQFSPLPWYDNGPLYWIRLLVGGAMLFAILWGVVAIQRRNFTQHGAWMLRAYALALGAGTQVFTLAPYGLLVGTPDAFTKALLMAAGWGINLAVAEWVIYRRRSHSTRSAAVSILQPG